MNTVDYQSATPISNYTYEDRLQEEKTNKINTTKVYPCGRVAPN